MITIRSTRGAYGRCTTQKVWADSQGRYYELNLGAEYLNCPIENYRPGAGPWKRRERRSGKDEEAQSQANGYAVTVLCAMKERGDKISSRARGARFDPAGSRQRLLEATAEIKGDVSERRRNRAMTASTERINDLFEKYSQVGILNGREDTELRSPFAVEEGMYHIDLFCFFGYPFVLSLPAVCLAPRLLVVRGMSHVEQFAGILHRIAFFFMDFPYGCVEILMFQL